MTDDNAGMTLPPPETIKQKRAYRRAEKAFRIDPPETDFHIDTNGAAPPKPADMVTVKLLRNSKPMGPVEVIGYWQDEIARKDPIIPNKVHIIQPKAFIPGVVKPSSVAGVGYEGKLWAGTVVKLPRAEAKAMIANDVAVPELE